MKKFSYVLEKEQVLRYLSCKPVEWNKSIKDMFTKIKSGKERVFY